MTTRANQAIALMAAVMLSTSVACSDEDEPECDVSPLDVTVIVTSTTSPLLDHGCIGPVACAALGQYVDADPDASGMQYDCDASDIQRLGQPDQAEQVLPACDASASNVACWRARSDANECTDGEDAVLEIVRAAPPPADNRVAAFCNAVCLSCAAKLR
jgi:hypothetical protein